MFSSSQVSKSKKERQERRRGKGEVSGAAQCLPFPRAFSETNTGQVSVLLGDGLRLSDEPLERFLAALFLQLLPDHVPAGLVVVVEPVTLRERERQTDAVRSSSPLPKAAQAECEGPTC